MESSARSARYIARIGQRKSIPDLAFEMNTLKQVYFANLPNLFASTLTILTILSKNTTLSISVDFGRFHRFRSILSIWVNFMNFCQLHQFLSKQLISKASIISICKKTGRCLIVYKTANSYSESFIFAHRFKKVFSMS